MEEHIHNKGMNKFMSALLKIAQLEINVRDRLTDTYHLCKLLEKLSEQSIP